MEKGSFTSLVFSTSGGMGGEAERLVKKLASEMEYHNGQRYSDAVGNIRKRLRFQILRTTVISLRGDRGARNKIVDINVVSAYKYGRLLILNSRTCIDFMKF